MTWPSASRRPTVTAGSGGQAARTSRRASSRGITLRRVTPTRPDARPGGAGPIPPRPAGTMEPTQMWRRSADALPAHDLGQDVAEALAQLLVLQRHLDGRPEPVELVARVVPASVEDEAVEGLDLAQP